MMPLYPLGIDLFGYIIGSAAQVSLAVQDEKTQECGPLSKKKMRAS